MSRQKEYLDAKKATALLILDKRKISSVDLKGKILVKAFPPPTWETIGEWLKQKGLPSKIQPEDWDWDWDELLREDEIDYTDFGLWFEARSWLRQMAHLLGLTYEDWGKTHKRHLSNVGVCIPSNWAFDPDRQVCMIEICFRCEGKILAGEAMYKCRLGICCRYCVKHRTPPGERIPSQDGYFEDDEYNALYDAYPYTTSTASPLSRW